MLSVRGVVWRVFKQESRDKETGEVIVNDRVQILGDIPMVGGQEKSGIVEFKCTERVAAFQAAMKKEVRVYVDQFHTGADRGGLYLVKGSVIELVDAKGLKLGEAESKIKAA